MDQPILDEQRRRNRETRPRWKEYANHRQTVTRLLLGVASPAYQSLCLLGAGNCNDLDLGELTGGFPIVHLVDIDEEALSHASKQVSGIDCGRRPPQVGIPAGGASGPHSLTAAERGEYAAHGVTGPRHFTTSNSSQLVVHPALDVSGVATELETWKGKTDLNEEDFSLAITHAKQAAPVIDGEPFDVVASCCLLSQLIDSVVLTKTDSHPRFLTLLFAVRNRHLQLLWHWTKPGGVVVMVTDFVSSATFPQLATMTSAQLSAAVPQLIAQRNFFTGTNPVAVREAFQGLGAAGPAKISDPWVWPVGSRVFAVCAVVARKP